MIFKLFRMIALFFLGSFMLLILTMCGANMALTNL